MTPLKRPRPMRTAAPFMPEGGALFQRARARWTPAGGYSGQLIQLVLPITVLALPHAGRIARLTRGSMIEVLGTNFIRTARSKGIGTRLILARHALKPALIPVVSYLGPGL